MKVRLNKAYGAAAKGDLVDYPPSIAAKLIARGVGVPYETAMDSRPAETAMTHKR